MAVTNGEYGRLAAQYAKALEVVEAARLAARAAWGREIAEFDALIDALAVFDEVLGQ